MSQAKFENGSQRLGELAPAAAFFLLGAWGHLALLVAILVACVSVGVAASPLPTHAISSLSGDLSAPGSAPVSDATHIRHAPSPWSEDQPALESECDDLDSDSETTSESPVSLELSHRPSLVEKAPNPGTLLPAAHLRISVGFARGPPSVG